MIKHIYIFFLLFSGLLAAQNPIRLTVQDGLPSNHVYDVLEDKDGFMWFATNRGVAKYNGESFKSFTIKDGLPNNDIWMLDRDHNDNLWYFSKSKYQGYIKNDSVYKFKTENDKVITPYIYKTNNSFTILWDGVYELKNDTLKNNSKSINLECYEKVRLKYGVIFFVAVNHFKESVLGLVKDGVVVLDKNCSVINEAELEIKLTSEDMYKMSLKRNDIHYNNITVIQLPKGFLSIDKTSLSQKYYTYKALGIQETTTSSLSKIIDDHIQITLDNNLLIFDKDFNLIKKHILPKNIQFSRAFKDSKENIWMIGYNGVYLIPKQQFVSNYFLKNKLTKKIGFINNKLLVGVDVDAIYKIEDNKGIVVPELEMSGEKIYQLETNKIVSVYNSYALNNDVLPLEFQVKNSKIKDPQVNKYSNFKDFAIVKDSIYLITGVDIVKSSLKTKTGQVIQRKSGLLEIEVFKEKKYFGGSDGLWLLKKDSLVRPENFNSILETNINNITKNGNYLYIATDGRGVYAYNENDVTHLKNTDDLIVQKIIKQGSKLWLATQKGVVEVSLNPNTLEKSKISNRFLVADGLLQNNVNDIYIKDHILYVLSDIGMVKLDVENPVYNQAPKLYFNHKKDTLSFKNKERDNVMVSFSALDYSNQKSLNYSYKLLPTQNEWVTTTTKTLNFSNLSPSVYTLKIKGTNQHNKSTIITQYLNIKAKWFETLTAKITFVILGVFVLFLMFYLFKKRIKEKTEQDKRISGLELQALRSQMNPHFVHNSLNAIQYYIQRNEVEASENYLVKFSKLIRLYFEYSREQAITIKKEIELLTYYLEIEKLRFEDKLNYTISICENLDSEEQLIPSMLLQPIVENAVNHGLFHKVENGMVTINFKQINPKSYQVTITDDGIGIVKAKSIQKTSAKNYQSKSSQVLSERLALLNQSKFWNIVYTIEDRFILNKEQGTIVTLIFKSLEND